jgi:GT2 family glycosyltransferase
VRRLLYSQLARLSGLTLAVAKALAPPRPDPEPGPALPAGITVVVPSRDGRELLSRLLPGVAADLAGVASEIIVVDNGSTDGTAAWLAHEWPQVSVEPSATPLGFSVAVNRGIARARYSHLCLLNNDMVIEPGFFAALRRAFDCVPGLFSATAQIFFPPGERRQETGLAVKPPRAPGSRDPGFPLWCNEPTPGEDHSWVLYGSGGCSLYDTRRLRQLGMYGEQYAPAYVEDLDIGYRAWQRGWPSVYVAAAHVLHHHRATTSRFFTEAELALVLERNYLRFLAGAVASPRLFLELWRENLRRGLDNAALAFAARALFSLQRPPAELFDERRILLLGSGEIRCFPGTGARTGRVRVVSHPQECRAGETNVLVMETEAPAPEPDWLARCAEVILARGRAPFVAALSEARRKWGAR